MSLEQYGSAMTEEEVVEFLEGAGIGTIAFGSEAGGYALPMSFGYDRVRDCCVFQFAFGEGSVKRAYVDVDNPISLSVHEWEHVDEWRSVVARGTLHPIDEERIPTTAGIFATYAKIASPEVFRQPLGELDFEWYELRVEEKRGRKAHQNQ
ncbi:MAG: pyridoxamine 5'-phosphate oxidase family protein [Halobacteriota archaeon]